MNVTEFASLGGRARWKGVKSKARKAYMSKIAKLPRKRKARIDTASKSVV